MSVLMGQQRKTEADTSYFFMTTDRNLKISKEACQNLQADHDYTYSIN